MANGKDINVRHTSFRCKLTNIAVVCIDDDYNDSNELDESTVDLKGALVNDCEV